MMPSSVEAKDLTTASPKRARIIGVTGQDCVYRARHLIAQGYHVSGTFRRTSTPNFCRLEEVGVADDPMLDLIERCQPDEVYNLAAESLVSVSFEQPATTAQITGIEDSFGDRTLWRVAGNLPRQSFEATLGWMLAEDSV